MGYGIEVTWNQYLPIADSRGSIIGVGPFIRLPVSKRRNEEIPIQINVIQVRKRKNGERQDPNKEKKLGI